MRSARPTVLNDESALSRMAGDTGLFLEVIRMFREDCPARVVALKAAVEQGNLERIRAEAHAMRGAAANISAGELSEAAKVLEQIGLGVRREDTAAAWRALDAAASAVLDELTLVEQRLTESTT